MSNNDWCTQEQNSIIHRVCGPRLHTSTWFLMGSIVQGTTLFYELLVFAEWEYDDVDREQKGSDVLVGTVR